MRTFGKKSRSKNAIEKNEFLINEALDINDHTMCNADFPDPCMTCCFITDTTLFVNVFHNKLLMHYHFIYDTNEKKIVTEVVTH